jgi:hypothetical protein
MSSPFRKRAVAMAPTAPLPALSVLSDDLRFFSECVRDELDATTRKVAVHASGMPIAASMPREMQQLIARQIETRMTEDVLGLICYMLGFLNACSIGTAQEDDPALRLAYVQLRDAITTKRREYEPR